MQTQLRNIDNEKLQYNDILSINRRPWKKFNKEIKEHIHDEMGTVMKKLMHKQCVPKSSGTFIRPTIQNKLMFNQMKENYVNDLKKAINVSLQQ